MSRLTFITIFTIFSGIAILNSGCQVTKGVESALIDKGIIPLSPTNPYVGSNVFLSQEAEKSSYLQRFLENRSVPQAVEVISPTKMALYYPPLNEKYFGDLQTSETSYEWILRGPYKFTRDDFKKTRSLYNAESGVIILHGQVSSFRPTATPTPKIIVVTPTPKPKTRRPAIVARPAVSPTPSPTPTLDFINSLSYPLNSDQQALLSARGYAERTKDGDLIHTLKEGESVESVVEWYTKDKSKLPQILAASGIDAVQGASAGYKIIIPKSMIKESKKKR